MSVVLDEVEKEDVLALVANGGVQRPLGLLLEHVVEESGRHLGEVVAGEVVPVGRYELIAVRLERVRRYLLGHLEELDAIAHVDERQQAVLALVLELDEAEPIRLAHHLQVEVVRALAHILADQVRVHPAHQVVANLVLDIFSQHLCSS